MKFGGGVWSNLADDLDLVLRLKICDRPIPDLRMVRTEHDKADFVLRVNPARRNQQEGEKGHDGKDHHKSLRFRPL